MWKIPRPGCATHIPDIASGLYAVAVARKMYVNIGLSMPAREGACQQLSALIKSFSTCNRKVIASQTRRFFKVGSRHNSSS